MAGAVDPQWAARPGRMVPPVGGLWRTVPVPGTEAGSIGSVGSVGSAGLGDFGSLLFAFFGFSSFCCSFKAPSFKADATMLAENIVQVPSGALWVLVALTLWPLASSISSRSFWKSLRARRRTASLSVV